MPLKAPNQQSEAQGLIENYLHDLVHKHQPRSDNTTPLGNIEIELNSTHQICGVRRNRPQIISRLASQTVST